MNPVQRFERWMFAAGSPNRLAAVRIGLMSVLALRLTRGIYADLAGQAPALFRPLSFMKVLPAMPSRPVVVVVQIIAFVAAVAAVAGIRIRSTIPIAWGGAMLLMGMTTSLGKVMHNDVLLVLCIVPLLWARSADAFAPGSGGRERRNGSAYGWPVRTMMLVVVGSYFLAAIAKLDRSGLAWVTSDNMRWILYSASDSAGSPNGWALFVADRAWLAHITAGLALTLEATFPIVLFKPRLTPLYVLAAVGLHTGIWLAIGLDYWAHTATVVIVLTDWPVVAERAARLRRRGFARASASA